MSPSHFDPSSGRRDLPLTAAQAVTQTLARMPMPEGLRRRLINRLRTLVGRRSHPGLLLTRFDGDLLVWVSLNDHIESQIFWQGYQRNDRGKLILWRRLVDDRTTAVDVGANIGIFTLTAAKRTPGGRIHAFEPARDAFDRLVRNVQTNDLHNVNLNKLALASRSGERGLWVPVRDDDDGKARINRGKASFYRDPHEVNRLEVETVATTTLDEYLNQQGSPVVDLIKLDVEGSEIDVLEGAENVLRRSRPRLLLEMDDRHLQRSNREAGELFELLAPLGYRIAVIHHDGGYSRIEGAHGLTGHNNLYCFCGAPRN